MRVDGRIQFEYATCGRGNFLLRKEKVADSKISGYVWTSGPHLHVASYEDVLKACHALHLNDN